jgi:hypothetical protein
MAQASKHLKSLNYNPFKTEKCALLGIQKQFEIYALGVELSSTWPL